MMTVAQNTREYLREQAAYSALAIAKAEGCKVDFQDRAQNDFVKLWAVPGPESTRLEDDGLFDQTAPIRGFLADG